MSAAGIGGSAGTTGAGRAVYIQIYHLAQRSVVRTLRKPATVLPAIIFPMLLLAVYSSGLGPASRLPGFPADSYLNFIFVFPLVQGPVFAAISAGTDLARDVESGFLNRLTLTPMHPVSLLAGMLAGVIALGLVQGVVFLTVGIIAGVEISTGLLGMPVILLFSVLVALGFGGVGAIFALRTGSAEAVQGMFPLIFVSLFLSSMIFPRELIENDWFRAIATVNPVSYMAEGIRSLIITGWSFQELSLGLLAAGGLVVAGLVGASYSLRVRLEAK